MDSLNQDHLRNILQNIIDDTERASISNTDQLIKKLIKEITTLQDKR
ncbi:MULTISPECIES: hypothetical protein [Pontibacillus]|uniref:Uncharacterized protein n=1 Tax=Pontibacillus chungwhensis TaxID=265426 RepID=A0ABY8UVW5_9BACI|nr:MULTISPECIES: hypothetical protein [Pontibacillus]MCD5325932.1 hypothetical protein [Pontibacillus sp. HN14]WIF97642.1 hypothetical protein QNI29_18230 [Pontibacillus chungwhensis]